LFEATNHEASKNCRIFPFNFDAILHKSFENDLLQEAYFVIASFQQLNATLNEVQVHLLRKIVL